MKGGAIRRKEYSSTMRYITLAALFGTTLWLAAPADAANVQLLLNVDQTLKTWEVRARIQDTTSVERPGRQVVGIGGFAFSVEVTGDIAIPVEYEYDPVNDPGTFLPGASVAAPTGQNPAPSTAFFGFTILGTPTFENGNVYDINGNQQYAYAGPTSAGNDARVLQGIGLTPGTRNSRTGPVVWESNVLLANGVYTGGLGTLSVRAGAKDGDGGFVLLIGDDGGVWHGGNTTASGIEPFRAVPVLPDVVAIVPEPGTFVLAGLGLVTLLPLVRRRRAA
jgi:hypothetical protein